MNTLELKNKVKELARESTKFLAYSEDKKIKFEEVLEKLDDNQLQKLIMIFEEEISMQGFMSEMEAARTQVEAAGKALEKAFYHARAADEKIEEDAKALGILEELNKV